MYFDVILIVQQMEIKDMLRYCYFGAYFKQN